ncbi:hypothetical protein ON010_g7118 [Phytophthora cinnamomi]|nr:hypothetical protein ON010_g7118 [Phytophthora cinnamomi]
MGEERRYEAENGDFCSTRFTVTQFEDAQSVKQVFDLLLFYFCNIEISISEKIGHITIREDDGADDRGIVQNRLVSVTHKDVKMESNTVMFSQYFDRSADKRNGQADSSYGLIVADFVDEDERHPYVPSQRVRRDVNAVLEVREFTPQHPKSVAGGPPSRKSVVVLSRWVQNRMHYPKFPVCPDGWYELRDNMDLWGRALHRLATFADAAPAVSGAARRRVPPSWSGVVQYVVHDFVSSERQRRSDAVPAEAELEEKQVDGRQNDADSAETERPKRKRKHRKGTHTIRKVPMDTWWSGGWCCCSTDGAATVLGSVGGEGEAAEGDGGSAAGDGGAQEAGD